jgi:hypothetical protein
MPFLDSSDEEARMNTAPDTKKPRKDSAYCCATNCHSRRGRERGEFQANI